MKKKLEVLVAGELNMDLILSKMNRFPEKGKEILAAEMTLTLGSSSAIFASNLSMLGTGVCFTGKIGKDQFGRQILRHLSEKEIDTNAILSSDVFKTGITVALSYENENAMVTHPGAMAEFKEYEISDKLLQSCKHLHVSSIFLQPALKRGIIPLFKRAKNAGLTTSMDTQWDPEENWDIDWKRLLPFVDIFMPNMNEIKSITRQDNYKDCINTIKDFSNTIVIKNGTKGSIGWEKGRFFSQPAFLNNDIRDTIGAGDSFDAGFIHRFMQNKPINDCLEFGALCGAINTTCYGGTTAFNNKKEIQKIASEQFKYHLNDL